MLNVRLRSCLALLVTPLAMACGASNADKGGEAPSLDTGTPGDDGGLHLDDAGPGPDIGIVSQVTITPSNAVIAIDTASGKPVAGTQKYTVSVHNDDGTDTDVSSVATLTVDPAFGTFSGSNFTSGTTLPGGKPGTTVITANVVDKSGTGKQGQANLTLIELRATGDTRDFFFLEPYNLPPTPARDVLKFGTNIQQVDVAFSLDTTGSMGGVIAGMKANISAMIPKLKTAIPNVGIAIAGHDDFPYDGHGSGADLPFYLLHTVTTSVTDAQKATNEYATHSGDDGPESPIESQYQILTGDGVNWPGGAIKKKTNAPGTYGYVDFRPGSLPVTVEITDIESHEVGDYRVGTEPAPHPHSMDELLAAFKKTHARGVGIPIGGGFGGGPIPQMTKVAEASNAIVPPSAFKPGCGAGQCCTEEGGVGRAPDAADGKNCLLIFKASYTGTGTSDSIVSAIAALATGTNFDVTAQPSNDPTNPGGVDATKFIHALRAMDEGDPKGGCPPVTAKDTDGDGVKDTFTAIPVGTPVCFEVIPEKNTFVKPTKDAQFFNAFINVLGMPGAINLDVRGVLFLVPPAEIIAR